MMHTKHFGRVLQPLSYVSISKANARPLDVQNENCELTIIQKKKRKTKGLDGGNVPTTRVTSTTRHKQAGKNPLKSIQARGSISGIFPIMRGVLDIHHVPLASCWPSLQLKCGCTWAPVLAIHRYLSATTYQESSYRSHHSASTCISTP
jgi:hypothetical protein